MAALRLVITFLRRWAIRGAIILSASITCSPVGSLPDADALVNAADSVGERPFEGRLSGPFQWKPLKEHIDRHASSRLLRIASGLNLRLRNERTSPNACAAGAALIL